MVDLEDPEFLSASYRTLLLWTSSSMVAVSVISVAIRFTSRIATKVPLLLDDWLILGTLPLALAQYSITIWGTLFHGLGTHIFGVIIRTKSYDTLHDMLRGLYAFEITYLSANAGTKFSMLAIYWRIFPHPKMKWPLILTAGVTVAFLIATMMTAIFACDPIQGFWMFELEKKCISSLPYFIAVSAVNITIDLVMLLIPITMVARLQMAKVQKIAVSAIFGLGIFVTFCSCIRLNQLILANQHGLYVDPTWNLIGPALWSDIEVSASILTACLPTMRPLLRLVWRRTFKNPTRGGHSALQRSGRGSDGQSHIFYRFDDNRPLSGAAGDGHWMGKGVGLPSTPRPKRSYQVQVQTKEMRLDLAQSPVSPLPPVYRDSPVTAVQPRPPLLPLRNPLRHLTQRLGNKPAPPVISRPQPFTPSIGSDNEKQPPVAVRNTHAERPKPGPLRNGSFDRFFRPAERLPSNEDVNSEARMTLIRDPITRRYVMSPPQSATRLSPDSHKEGWKDDLEPSSISIAWDPSMRRSRNEGGTPSPSTSVTTWV